MIERFAPGLLGAAAIASGAWQFRTLSRGGAVAATILGTATVSAGWHWGGMLIAFFIIGTLLSRLGRDRKTARTAEVMAKTGARDAWQVAANGGVYGVGAILAWQTAEAQWAALAVGALAGALADTAATEIGTLVGGTPRSILTGRALAPGLSGGITLSGSLAAVAGALLIAALALAVGLTPQIALAGWIGGTVGAFVDSLLGATVQARRQCPSCATPTERRMHHCGGTTRLAGGVAWIDNDGVNAVATVGAGLVAIVVVRALGGG